MAVTVTADLVTGDQVAADDAGTHASRLLDHPLRERVEPARVEVAGSGNPGQQGDRPGAHRGDVGEVHGHGLAPHLAATGPVPAKV